MREWPVAGCVSLNPDTKKFPEFDIQLQPIATDFPRTPDRRKPRRAPIYIGQKASQLECQTKSAMFGLLGPFRVTSPLSGGLLWKTPWRLSKFQKRRHRLRLRAVDSVVATVDAALAKKGETLEALERWKAEMPTEAEMLPKDKYTMFDRKAKRYRKGIHSKNDGNIKCLSNTDSHVCRIAKVDESIAKTQPPRFLIDLHKECFGRKGERRNGPREEDQALAVQHICFWDFQLLSRIWLHEGSGNGAHYCIAAVHDDTIL